MELQAAVLGVRAFATVKAAFQEDLKISSVTYWTDSQTVLCWLRTTNKRFSQFIGNRVGEILESSNPADWRWVPTSLNVADDATRLKTTENMNAESRWLSGPAFLLESEQEWPVQKHIQLNNVEESELEIRDSIHIMSQDTTDVVPFDALPDVTRFSSWYRLIRATASVILAARKWRKIKPERVTIDDLVKAEKMWIRKVQHDTFSSEIDDLKNGNSVSSKSRLFKLSPTQNDEGIIVLKGRTGKAPQLENTVKNPPILCPHHPYTRLLIDWYHQKSKHFGQERVLNELRKIAWIIHGRQAVRKSWAKCLICKMRKCQPLTMEMGQLPAERVESHHPPFFFTGMDLFGPYLVSVKRSNEKRWGVIFTCLSTRAVHLDLVESLSSSDFINALVRFISVRGKPAVIWSDNGTNFVGADRILKENLEKFNEEVSEHLIVKGITYKFIAPASPSMGGVYERMIGSTKKILMSLLKCQHPKEGVLRTLLCEVMDILNSRPITYLSPDPDDSECLTPNHLLKLACVASPSIPCPISNADVYGKSWKYAQYLVDQFWKRWNVEYLPMLAKREKWNKKAQQLKKGDLVIVNDDQAPRNSWKKGVITETFPGRDDVVRVVEVEVTTVDPEDKKKIVKRSRLRRHVTKICPLSLSADDNHGDYGRENVAEGSNDKQGRTAKI